MEKAVLEQALSEADFCSGDNSWGYPRGVAYCLEMMFRELLTPNSEKPVWKIVRAAIVDICATFPVEIELEDYGFDKEEL